MKKKNFAIFEIICYVVAAVLGIVALYMGYENFAYINEYAAAYGATFADLGSQAIQSIVSAFIPYFAYAFIVLGIGRIYHQVAVPKCEAEEVVEEVVEEPVEEVLAIAEPVEEVAEVVETEAVEEEPAAEEPATEEELAEEPKEE